MFGWIRRLFGGGKAQAQELHGMLPPFQVEAITAEDVKEIIDWGLESLGIPDVWKITQGEGVKVAILDTGAATMHPDLKDRIIATKDFTGDGIEDANGHGTHCAGIVAASQNGVGVVGVAPQAQLLIGKVLNDSGYGTLEWIAKGMEWAVEAGADIVSMSLGSRVGSDRLKEATAKVIGAGKILIIAAGNDGEGEDTVKYPGAYPDVICVGSINREMRRSKFSSTGRNLTLMAPGEKILSSYPPDQYARLSGTSMATPFVAGVAALILSKHRKQGGKTPCENQKQMYEHLVKVAVDAEDPGWDKNTGWGIVNPKKSIEHPHARA